MRYGLLFRINPVRVASFGDQVAAFMFDQHYLSEAGKIHGTTNIGIVIDEHIAAFLRDELRP